MPIDFEHPPERLYETAHEHGIRVELKGADDAVLAMRGFEPSPQPELAVGVVAEGGYACGYVPVLDVALFAARECPKALARALVRAGLAAGLERAMRDAAQDLDRKDGA